MSDEKKGQKWGTEHARAWMRQGLAELRGVFYAESNVAQPTEYGMLGTKTPSEVQRGLDNEPSVGDAMKSMFDRSASQEHGESASVLEPYLRQAETEREPETQDRRADGLERE